MKVIAKIERLVENDLTPYQRAIYIAKSNSQDLEHKNLYRAGAAGNRGGQNGLSNRYRQHHLPPEKERNLALAARAWDFIWAVDLTDWSTNGTGLAENFLHGFLAHKFFFLDGSSFRAESKVSVLTELMPVFTLLKNIESRQRLPQYVR